MKKLIWIAFDLGIRGDYEGMYEFLDVHEAKECGDSLAVLQFDFKRDLLTELEKDLSRLVEFDRKSRVYVVFPDNKGSYKGRFLVGRRKSTPWTGYGKTGVPEEDSSE